MRKILLSAMTLLMTTAVLAQDFCFDEMTYTPQKTVFKLFAPNKTRCVVKVGGRTVKMRKTGDCLWKATVKGDLLGQPYVFNAGFGDTPGVFAKAVGVNGREAYVVDLAKTNPEGWESDRRPVCLSPADLVVYELHHRDFSIARPDAKYPGKFLALTEPWAIDHLKSLGINAVHLLPSYDYGSVDETHLEKPQYNWGYDPVNYNVPEGSYSTDPYRPEVRIHEFKQMVQALHQAGIRVILDVVYNHTFDIDHSNFQLTYPDYFYRKSATTPDGSPSGYSNGSGCGNETASERPMMRRFMTESVKYWVNEYHIDGFRFDLMGVHDIETMNQIRQALDEIDPTLFIYGEGWSAGSCGLPGEQLGVKANIPQMPRIAAFSDELRDALRGPFDNDAKPGILGGAPGCTESVKYGIVGCISHPQVDMSKVNYSKQPWAVEPTQMMSYVSCHDDMCLVDRLRASVPSLHNLTISPLDSSSGNSEIVKSSNSEIVKWSNSEIMKLSNSQIDELVRLDLLAQTTVFTSQGVPFMLSGEELLRDKKGVHNSYNSPDSINHLDWQNKQRYPQVFEYYKNLIALRRLLPHFRLGSAELVRRHLQFLDAPEGVVAFRITSPEQTGPQHVYVVLNFTREKQSIDVPRSLYRVVCSQGIIKPEGIFHARCSQVLAAPQSALIIHTI